MRKRTIAVSVAVLMAVSSQAVHAEPAVQVFAHYYTWWAGNRPDYPLMPKRGWYVNQFRGGMRGEPATIFQFHIAQARSFGLAGFSIEWPGRRSPETRIIREAMIPSNNALPPERQMKYLLCFDTTIWAISYQKIIENWYDPIPFDDQIVDEFVSEMVFICESLPKTDPMFKKNYLHLDSRPAVFVYNAHSFAGQWRRAMDKARERCDPSGGIYLIGDFEVSPHPMFDKKREDDYAKKAKAFDAVTNYTLLSGHTTVTMHEYITSGQLTEALANGRALGRASRGGKYFPGIIPQYFKSRSLERNEPVSRECRKHMRDRTFVTTPDTGYAPVYRSVAGESQNEVNRKSRRTLEILIGATLAIKPEIVFVTSWNEPFEGTMVEPTKTANPSCYVMGTDFVDLIERGTKGEPLGDCDRDGDVDKDDAVLLERPEAASKRKVK